MTGGTGVFVSVEPPTRATAMASPEMREKKKQEKTSGLPLQKGTPVEHAQSWLLPRHHGHRQAI